MIFKRSPDRPFQIKKIKEIIYCSGNFCSRRNKYKFFILVIWFVLHKMSKRQSTKRMRNKAGDRSELLINSFNSFYIERKCELLTSRNSMSGSIGSQYFKTSFNKQVDIVIEIGN